MAKGDIDKSDANGSRKNEKQSKENKEKDSKKNQARPMAKQIVLNLERQAL